MMRWIWLGVAWICLLTAAGRLWSLRFERQAGMPPVTLDTLRQQASDWPVGVAWSGDPSQARLSVGMSADRKPLAFRLPIRFPSEIGMLHVVVGMQASALERGPEEWQDGRILLEWIAPDGEQKLETDPIGSVRDEHRISDREFVLRPPSGAAGVVLRFEHLGRSGSYHVERLELTPVRERALWTRGGWLLLAGYAGWLWFLLATLSGAAPWRRAAALATLLVLTTNFVVPGPWKSVRPLVIDFNPGPAVQAGPMTEPSATRAALPSPVVVETESLGKLPVTGGLAIQIRYRAAVLKPLMHVAMLLGPTILFALLLGRRPALMLGVGFSLAVELSQTAFGFGFGWDDVFDLACNAAGIALGLRAATKIAEMRKRMVDRR